MKAIDEQSAIEFHRYPPIGGEDWSFAFATARARVLDTTLLTRSTFMDMINAPSFSEALAALSSTDYAMGESIDNFAQVEQRLLEVRTETRSTYANLLPEDYVELLRAREDFKNMRLAIRRIVTERPIGTEYSNDGNVPAEDFEDIFEKEDYSRFPLYLQEGVEQAILGYYNTKDIRQIDYGIDRAQAAYNIDKARELDSVFLLSLARMNIDLDNIRTMLRLKMAERSERDLFIEGGFVDISKFVQGLDAGYDTLGTIFFSTPYVEIIEEGVNYLNSNHSFLGLERKCEEYKLGFLQSTSSIAAGPQPVVAHFIRKESEIRAVRMVLSGKHNGMDTQLIKDRLPYH
ncbi:V-ATPase subunit C [Anaerohalosphaera lusitana]|uniref:V-ATPase subunit C n=1 Tax=Anaerohalosphaera lusitana TaxID=1936003 RepID=A0A1U9NJA3_9BACT|nr:V-type ATPase subunit [Anaerohalosphaera lusitana]AQT68009.1 V-ATPase subunit C [Anaerohalosphaera lusitana]